MAEYNNYFPRQFIDNDFLNFDNEASRLDIIQRFNILTDIPGVVQGYKDSLNIIPGSLPNSVTILPGVAFDGNGNIMEVVDSENNIVFDNTVGITYFVKIRYKQLKLAPGFDPITGAGPNPLDPSEPYYTRLKDYYDIVIDTLVPDLLEVEIGRVIGNGAGNLITTELIDITQRKILNIKEDLLIGLDHANLSNIGTLSHTQLEERLTQLFTDTGITPTPDGSPSLDIPLSDLIGNFYDHNHSGPGQGGLINHNSLINVTPDQHHKKIHKHSLDPGSADDSSPDGFVEKINLSDDTTDPIEVRGKLSGDYIKDETITDQNISLDAQIQQSKIDITTIIDNNFNATPVNHQEEVNQLRTQIKRVKFGQASLNSFNDPQNESIESLSQLLNINFDQNTGHKHTGTPGDGPKLNDDSILPKSLTSASIADNSLVNSVINSNANIDESKLNLSPSYEWRNYILLGESEFVTYNAGSIAFGRPIVCVDGSCYHKFKIVTSSGPVLAPVGSILYAVLPQKEDYQDLNFDGYHDFEIELQVTQSQISVTERVVVLGYVNELDTRLYVNWSHNPFHQHRGGADGEKIDISSGTSGLLPLNRIAGNLTSVTDVDDKIEAHNTSLTAHQDIRDNISDLNLQKVAKAGDTMNGNLNFPAGSSVSNSIGAIFNDGASPNLKLFRKTGTSELHIGYGSNGNRVVIFGTSGNIQTEGNFKGVDLSLQNGVIRGSSNRQMTQTDNNKLTINPGVGFVSGTKIEGITDVDEIHISNHIIKNDSTKNAVVFNNSINADNLYVNSVSEYITDLLLYFYKENLTSYVGSSSAVLSRTPVPNSISLIVIKGTNDTVTLVEGIDYTVSSTTINFTNPLTQPSGLDQLFVQYAVNGVISGPLAISGLTPNNGSTSGGDLVVINGSGFTNVTSVTFDGNPVISYVINSGTEITVVTPPGSVGPVDVTITTALGSVTSNGAYNYV